MFSDLGQRGDCVFGKDRRKACLVGGIHSRDGSCLGFHLFHYGLLNLTRDQSDFQDVHCPEVL